MQLSADDRLGNSQSYNGTRYWAFTRYDRRTDRSVRRVGPTSRMKRLHVPIVGPNGRPDPGYVRLVGQTSRTDRSETVAEPPTSVNQINVAC